MKITSITIILHIKIMSPSLHLISYEMIQRIKSVTGSYNSSCPFRQQIKRNGDCCRYPDFRFLTLSHSGGCTGTLGIYTLPSRSNIFIFMQFLAKPKIDLGWNPPLGLEPLSEILNPVIKC